MIPYFVFLGVQILVALIGQIICSIINNLSAGVENNYLSTKQLLIITIITNIICIAAAIIEMKITKADFYNITDTWNGYEVTGTL